MFHARFPLTVLTALVLSTPAGCGDDAPTAGPGPAAAPAVWRLDTAPDHAVDIAAAKTTAKEGDTVTIRGKIGGRMQPLTEGSGLIVLMDHAVPSCADNPDDGCPTPWDYCCETPETISAHAATVQVRDAGGNPVTLPEGAFSGLDELVVVGTVAPRPNDDTLVLHATGVYRAAEFAGPGHDGHDH
mgnify:CR=1 FL=1